MKYKSLSIISFSLFIIIASCKKDDPQPLAYETQAKLLAGEKGQSKTWRLVSETQNRNGSAAVPANLPACFLDNNYIFTNNDKQDYISNEGASKCGTTDPATTESGTWSFTADGKMIIILTNKYATTVTSANSPAGLYINFPFPSEVTTLTDTSMVTKMTITQDTDTYVFTFTFAKV